MESLTGIEPASSVWKTEVLTFTPQRQMVSPLRFELRMCLTSQIYSLLASPICIKTHLMAVLKGIEPSSFGRQPNILTNVLQNQMETSTGIEPSNPAVKEQCVKPLHQLVIWRERKELNFHYLINSQPFYHWTTFPYGADDRNRTCNLLLTRQLLYLLSYNSI